MNGKISLVIVWFLIFSLAGCSHRAVRVATPGNPPLSDMTKRAIEQSQWTAPGSRPFHLKANVVEATNAENDDYKAEIEEYWQAPDKWRRTVKTNNLSQTLIVHGGKVFEEFKGDYYPHWLQTIIKAIFDPSAPMEGVDLSKSSDNPMVGGTLTCRRFQSVAGIPPVKNDVFSTFCLDGDLIHSISLPGYDAEYKNYERFSSKQVARKVSEWLEPGTELEVSINELSDLDRRDETLYVVQQPNVPLQTIVVSEKTLRERGVNTPAIQWPPIQDGKSSGVLSIYVCVDRNGHVRETYGLNSDNPYMTDAARKQVMNWQFKPTTSKGTSVQVESILTFAYETRIVTP